MKLLYTLLLSLMLLNTQAQRKISYIKMQRTACFGRCPEYTVELFQNGHLIYHGKKNVPRIGEYNTVLKTTLMVKFLKDLSKYKLENTKPLYKAIAADLPRLNFTIVSNGKTNTIQNGESGPAFLEAMGKKIDSLIETLTWKETYPAIPDASGPELNIDVKHNDIPTVEVVKSSSSKMNDNNEIFTYVEQPPSFKGGDQALMSFLAKNIVYPAIAKENNIQGKVICSFVVNKLGQIENVKVERGIGGGCNEEALRVLKSMPDWIPGKQNGQPVSVRYNIPVNFILK